MVSPWQMQFFSLPNQDEYKHTILMKDVWRKRLFVPLSFESKPWFWNEVCQFVQHKIPGCGGNLSRYNLFRISFPKQTNFHAHIFSMQRLSNTFLFPFIVLMCFFGDDNKPLYPKSEIFSLCLENNIKAIDVWFCFASSLVFPCFIFGFMLFPDFLY